MFPGSVAEGGEDDHAHEGPLGEVPHPGPGRGEVREAQVQCPQEEVGAGGHVRQGPG